MGCINRPDVSVKKKIQKGQIFQDLEKMLVLIFGKGDL
jgi:hypothetical protein